MPIFITKIAIFWQRNKEPIVLNSFQTRKIKKKKKSVHFLPSIYIRISYPNIQICELLDSTNILALNRKFERYWKIVSICLIYSQNVHEEIENFVEGTICIICFGV